MLLSHLKEDRTTWVAIPAWPGVDLLVKYISPEAFQKFREQLVKDGICPKDDAASFTWNPGRFPAFCGAMAKAFIVDWRGPIKADESEDCETTPYTWEKGQVLLSGSHGAAKALFEAIADERAFFGSNGNA